MNNLSALSELEEITTSENGTPENDKFFSFYRIEIKGTEDNPKKEVRVDFYKLTKLLKKLGFYRLDLDERSFIVEINDNVIREVNKEYVVDAFERYVTKFGDNLPDGVMVEMLLNKMYAGIGSFFSENILNRLQMENPIEFKTDTQTQSFFYYQNGFVEVTEQGYRLRPYSELDKAIWHGQILKRDFKPLKPDVWKDFSFVQFIHNVANNWIDKKTEKRNDPDRFDHFCRMIGYTMHSFFEDELKAPIWTDSRMDENASGRSGKTLLFKAIQHMLNASETARSAIDINGKDFDLSDKFKYQELGPDTTLVALNDIKPRFDFEGLFNDITEGLKVKRLYEAPFIVRSKIIVITNKTVKIQGESAKGRCVELEFADYYNSTYTPKKEFKQWFFRDWKREDWQKFDNFMLWCVQKYLKEGLTSPQTINLNERKFREETAPEFVDWVRAISVKDGKEYNKKDLYSQFLDGDGMRSGHKDQFSKLTPRTFSKWLKLYGEYDEDIEHYEERSSNGEYLITYFLTEEAKPESFDPDWQPEGSTPF